MSEKQTRNRKRAAGLTGRVKQHHVLSGVDAAFLCERSCDLLCALVKLHAGRRAHCCALKDSGNTFVPALILWITIEQNKNHLCGQLGTLALRRTKRTWSGSVCALH